MTTSNQTFRGKVSPDTSGEAFFKKNITATTPGVIQTLISEVVPAGFTVNIFRADVSCNMTGLMTVKIDSEIIGTKRVGSGNPNAEMTWIPFIPANEGETIVIEFESMAGKPSDDVEVYLQARKIPA